MSLLLAVLTTVASAHAADLGMRDLHGAPVVTARASVVVFWSMDCAACVADVAELTRSGADVVAVNTDAAGVRSSIEPFARSHGIDATLVVDPTGDLKRRFGAEATLVAPGGAALAQATLAEAELLVRTARR